MTNITRFMVRAAVIGLIGGPALAQGSNAPAPAEASIDAADIIVTANKREESLSKVGASVTALTAETLKLRQITSLEDIANATPGLQFANTGSNTPVFTLRGIGFNDSSIGIYPAVSVYLDQAPLTFPVLALHSAYDLERVEVLKGPQGTLFGQNSTGGAVNYVAAKPTTSLAAGADVSYGRFNQVTGNAFISGPLSPQLGIRVAATGSRRDGWQRSQTRPGDTNGREDYFAGRVLLDWKPSDRLSVTANLNGWVDQSDPQALQLVGKGPTRGTPRPGYVGAPFAVGNARDADWTPAVLDPATGQIRDFSPRSDRRFYQGSVRADLELSDALTLTSMTTYTHFKQSAVIDGDGMAIVDADQGGIRGTIKTFNQELRLANSPANPFRWIIGGNLERSKTAELTDARYFDNAVSSPANLNISGAADENRQSIHNYAVFANAEYDLTDRLKAIAGARYTDAKVKDYNCGFAYPGYNTNVLLNFLASLVSTVPFTPVGTGRGQCFTLNRDSVPGVPFRDTLHEDNVSWRAGLNFQATPLTMLYGTISRGFKAGSYPTLGASSYGSLQPVTQEQVTAYELGVKTRTSDGRFAINAAAFYSDYRDKQVKGKIIDTPNLFGPIDAQVNVPKSRILGFEADITARPMKGLTITANGTYLNTKILRYNGYDVNGAFRDFHGIPLPYTPKWGGSLDIDYKMTSMSGGRPFIGATLIARTKLDTQLGSATITFPAPPAAILAPGVGNPYVMPGYAIVNGRVGYESDSGWRAFLWGKNVFNKYYVTNGVAGSDTVARLAGMPATYGITIALTIR